MVLKDVAKDIEMHESTVSRITTNKYIDTPQGLFELKFFFHSGIKSYMGSSLSSIRVKNMIKEVVAEEDTSSPYTDDQMVQVLMKKMLRSPDEPLQNIENSLIFRLPVRGKSYFYKTIPLLF